jgi:hypothetical protein
MNTWQQRAVVSTVSAIVLMAMISLLLLPTTGSTRAQDDDTPTPSQTITEAATEAPATPQVVESTGNPEGRIDGVRVYFAESNGEASIFDRSSVGLTRFASLLRSLGAEIETVDWPQGIPLDADLVVLAGPQNSYNLSQTARLWAYLENGGSLLMLAEPVGQGFNALNVDSGFFSVTWSDVGFRTQNNILVRLEGDGEDEPFSPITSFDTTNLAAGHPITDGISSVFFDSARSLEVDFDPSVQSFDLTLLAQTTSDFYGEVQFGQFLEGAGIEFNIGQDFTFSEYTVALAYENLNSNGKVILIGDRDFITNGGGLRTSPPDSPAFLYPGNVQFLLNSVTWLLDNENIALEFEQPGPTATPTLTPTPTITPSPEPTAIPEGEQDDTNE